MTIASASQNMPPMPRRQFDQIIADGWPGVEAWQRDHEPETHHLEFKRHEDNATGAFTPSDCEQLAAAVSGFANTDGGVLVFGVHANGGNKQEPDRVQSIQGVPDVARFHKAVESRLLTATDPPVAGLRLESIAKPGTSRGVVVVDVPVSIGAPHRAAVNPINGVYYMRTATSTVLVPHPYLAALFHRGALPELQLHIQLWSGSGSRSLRLRCSLANVGRGGARFPAVRFDEVPSIAGDSFWRVALSQLVGPFEMTIAPPFADNEHSVTVRGSGIIYPGDHVTFAIATTLQNVDLPPGFVLPIKGMLFALDAPPVRFCAAPTVTLDPQYLENLILPVAVKVG